MHSSGMRTARLLTVSEHVLWRGGVPARRGVPALAGEGTCPGTPPPVNRMTDRQVKT